jgi:hypothetical protein
MDSGANVLAGAAMRESPGAGTFMTNVSGDRETP